VPSFLLQPVVENALEHGLSRRPGDGHLAVRARRAGDALVLEVEDDGIGLGDAAIEEGVGLSNVRRRLAALHGERARLVIESVAPSGARVTVTLPARTRGGRTAA